MSLTKPPTEDPFSSIPLPTVLCLVFQKNHKAHRKTNEMMDYNVIDLIVKAEVSPPRL